MPIPDYQSLMLPVLTASSKGEVRIGPVAEELADQPAGLKTRRISKRLMKNFSSRKKSWRD
jgi:hypothetical protein